VTEAALRRGRLTFAAPVIAVADVAASVGWFEARLGFRAAGTSGTPPVLASLRRDGVEVMLTRAAAPPAPGGLAAYLYVDDADADALHAELTALGAELTGPPVDRAWGCREVEARLPDGRSIVFGADLSGASDSH
jgi:catechol 2,3-dioxygenase-like lactoylglutathione lyase family enzyme